MRKIRLCFLAFVAIVGIISAFSTKHAKNKKYNYGVVGLTVNGHGYLIQPFDYKSHACEVGYSTCSITSLQPLPSPISVNDSAISRHEGIYVTN